MFKGIIYTSYSTSFYTPTITSFNIIKLKHEHQHKLQQSLSLNSSGSIKGAGPAFWSNVEFNYLTFLMTPGMASNNQCRLWHVIISSHDTPYSLLFSWAPSPFTSLFQELKLVCLQPFLFLVSTLSFPLLSLFFPHTNSPSLPLHHLSFCFSAFLPLSPLSLLQSPITPPFLSSYLQPSVL